MTKTTWGLGGLGVLGGLLIASSNDDCDNPCVDDDDGDSTAAGLIVAGASAATAAVLTPVTMTIDRGLLEADLVTPENCDKIHESEWKAMLGGARDSVTETASDVKETVRVQGTRYSDTDYELYVEPNAEPATHAPRGVPAFNNTPPQSPMDGI